MNGIRNKNIKQAICCYLYIRNLRYTETDRFRNTDSIYKEVI